MGDQRHSHDRLLRQVGRCNTARPESVTIDLIRDGKIVEHNGIGDFAQCMQQFETK
jgi:hypothetical protein